MFTALSRGTTLFWIWALSPDRPSPSKSKAIAGFGFLIGNDLMAPSDFGLDLLDLLGFLPDKQ